MDSPKMAVTKTTLSPQKCYFTRFPPLPQYLALNDRDICDLEMYLGGAFEPLTGYMCQADYLSVLNNMRLVSGEIWPMPFVLPISKDSEAQGAHWISGEKTATSALADSKPVIRLRDKLGTIVAEVEVSEVYEPDLELEMQKTLGTTDPNHPHVAYLQQFHRNCYYIGGKIVPLRKIERFDFKEQRITAEESRKLLKSKGWDVVVGFQTRNPMHRSHFELTLKALDEVATATGKKSRLLLTPAIGPTQPGDIDYYIRVRSYKKLLSRYSEDTVTLVLLPLAMRMAGPREAVWHAIIRKNYGCTHFIVGRDHAGPSTKTCDSTPFYGAYEAHDLLKSVQDELGIVPVFGKAMMFVEVDGNPGFFAEEGKIPEGAKVSSISGSQLRQMFEKRAPIPEWFSFPEVVDELRKFHLPQHLCGLCIYFTGLPCSGKSTLAMALEHAIRQNSNEKRKITILDADTIRAHLSKGLGFSQADRSSNVRRIGYVASEIVKHGGICLVANIAPYKEDREFNREIINKAGGKYVEVYVSTPLTVCEDRDVKELYKKARKGIIKQFTGISDPYQVPNTSELVVDSSSNIAGKIDILINYLLEESLIPPFEN